MTIQCVPGKKMETKRLFVGGLYSGIKEVDLRYVLLIISSPGAQRIVCSCRINQA